MKIQQKLGKWNTCCAHQYVQHDLSPNSGESEMQVQLKVKNEAKPPSRNQINHLRLFQINTMHVRGYFDFSKE